MEWLPIESAPKDGTEFIGYGTRHGEYGYTEDEQDWTGGKWSLERKAFVETKATGRYACGFTFSHWIPLPAPPGEKL